VKKAKIWQKAREQYLYKHVPTGVYYARSRAGNEDKWVTLETTVLSVAEHRVGKKIKELKKGHTARRSLKGGLATFGEASAAYLTSVESNPRLKASSKHYIKQTVEAIGKSWPDIAKRKLADISPSECEQWANSYARTMHPSRFNNTVASMRHIFDLAIDHGIIHDNPAAEVEKLRVTSKKLVLPSKEKFEELVKSMDEAGGAYSTDCADLVRFLAYSGCRLTEAAHVHWQDVDGAKNQIWIHGRPDSGTKNLESRAVPIIPQMRQLLDKLTLRDKDPRSPRRHGGDYVLNVTECTRALQAACDKVEITRISHHDLRHLFATRCIESGIDIPTVARWLGHKDGGALAMKTYGHLRDEHSQAMAARVSF
jgi:integrase